LIKEISEIFDGVRIYSWQASTNYAPKLVYRHVKRIAVSFTYMLVYIAN